MNKAWLKKYGTLMLLALGAGSIFQLPYIRETFYVPIQTAMNLTNEQMGALAGWYGIIATPAYFLGGIVADKFAPRLMLTFSFITTGLLGLWLATFPGYNACRLIFAIMGLTTVLTYWSSVIKATRMLGSSEEQGRLFGLQEGIRGFLNAGLVFAMAAVYASFADNVVGAANAMRLCAVLLLVIGVLCFIFIDNGNTKDQTESLKEVCLGMVKCFKIPRVWLLVAIVFTTYSCYGLMSYINTYLVNMCGMSEVAAANLGGIRYCLQGVGGIVGGFLADKLHSRLKVLCGAAACLALSWAAFIVLPAEAGSYFMVLANFFIVLILVYAMRSLYFADIDDAGLDVSITGRVSGILSTFGYLPDVFMFTMVGSWLDTYAGKAGYNRVFIYAAVMAVIGVVVSGTLMAIVKKDKKTAQ